MALAAPFPAAGRTTSVRSVSAAPSMRSTGIRLTARGRAFLMLGSALFLLVVVVLSGRFVADAGTTPAAGPATRVVVVQAGENLWQIARELAPGSDPREVVTAIRALNSLGSAPVEVGQSVVVPVFDTP